MPISDTGVVIEPSATAIARAQQIFTDTWVDANLNPQSSNGQFIQNQAIAITEREGIEASVVGSFNPDEATGVQLDALGSNLKRGRIAATYSTAPAYVTGLVGTTIPAGKRVSSTNGDIFLIEDPIVIGISGNATGSAKAQQPGRILTTANTLKNIVDSVPGWDTVNNPIDGTVGRPAQNDTTYRKSLNDRLATSSSGGIMSVLAAAASLNPVSYFAIDNRDTLPIVIDSVTLPPTAMILVLDGGSSDEDVANMLFAKTMGATMIGNHSFTIPIPYSPTRTFTAKWQIATRRALGLNIKLKLGSPYPPDLPNIIANLINDNFDFNVIGKTIEATTFIYILMQAGIVPLRGLNFSVGAITNLSEYTMPITDSLGDSIISSNVVIDYA